MTTLTVRPAVDRAPRRRRRRSDRATVYLLLLPSLLPVLVLSVFPLLRGIYLGFTDARAGRNVEISFTGLANYRELLHDELFWSSFRIGLLWAFSVTVLQFLLALGLALLLNQRLRFRGLARVLAVVPWAMPPVVVGILWRLVYHPDAGLLNEFLYRIGADGLRTTWLGDFSTALPAVIIVGVWAGMPQTTVVLLAGLQSVPRELHEAAAVDGADAWQRFRSVTLPSLMPVIVAITSLDFIWNFNSFGLVYVLTAGGPGGRTMLPMLFAYEEAFRYGDYGYAAALGNVMVVIVVALLAVYLRRRLREANQ
ncbi:carbohydrate ABC transporter permease [Micromonospora sp. HM5-17]|jgi:multiple sugar transport system permease protein|uniref:carbohydrate ABC transporter permease n=1 Tax=Micromonospora sp. HM5-17 TaxID=2487710 RepID=UPI000F499DBA|nr:sugar ABC transporter permease [Micromonospora sp. HM5-17]ROT32479.1 sugar ABC transporter permease [Micromonospora sp. HM5-17]